MTHQNDDCTFPCALKFQIQVFTLLLSRRRELAYETVLLGDFPGGPMIQNTSPSSAGGVGSIPDWRAKILHAWRP